MPESIISQFKREYNAPIEVDRQVGSINARDNINVLTRWEGMIVYVLSEGKMYILVGGVDNTNWQEVAGIEEAPLGGALYGRKDGAWELVPSSGEIETNFTVSFVGLTNPGAITNNNFKMIQNGSIYAIKGLVTISTSAIFSNSADPVILQGFPVIPSGSNSGIYFNLDVSIESSVKTNNFWRSWSSPANSIRISKAGSTTYTALTCGEFKPNVNFSSLTFNSVFQI